MFLGDKSPLFCYLYMILKEKILELAKDFLEEKKLFLVALDISSSNNIRIVVDSMEGMQISDCARLSRVIEQGLDRDTEDFDIEVSSPGLGVPFKVRQQYEKNIGKEVEVITNDGQKHKGILMSVNENDFSIEESRKEKVNGKKKKQIVKESFSFAYDATNKVRNVLKF